MAGEHTLVHGIVSDGLRTVRKVEMSIFHEGNALYTHARFPVGRQAVEIGLLLRLPLEASAHLGVTTLQGVNLRHEFVL